jgi:indolepyruvate ferredoxin oxidoreductase beta subunit
MKYDIVFAGVGGQGMLSAAAAIALSAMNAGLNVRQSEVHGMAQRGGAVQANLRISDGEIPGDLIGHGRADMILSMEPLETLRYISFLKPDGIIVASTDPFKNIPDYPDVNTTLEQIKSSIGSGGRVILVPTSDVAKEAGSAKSGNMVLVGAASSFLPVDYAIIKEAVTLRFKAKGSDVVEKNLEALDLGLKFVEKE